MGLDNVELLWTIERYFSIAITDKEAGQILTVQDFADCVAQHISPNSANSCSSQRLFYQLRHYFEKQPELGARGVVPTTLLVTLFPATDRQLRWEQLQQELQLFLPVLRKRDKNEHLSSKISFAGLKLHTRKSPLTQETIRQFIDWLLALNYKQLLPVEAVVSKYEVERIIVGIICETQGIPVEEIALTDRIVHDLGID